MNIRFYGAAALLLASALLGGCATSRSELKIAAPDATPSAPVTKQRAVVIRSVRDERQFAEKPTDPSVPSLVVQISDAGTTTLVSVSATDDRMAATEGAWTEIVQKALAAYRAEAARKVAVAPF